MQVHLKPLSWYVDKLERGEPFSSPLYGDGEFIVARGRSIGRTMQNGEIITSQLVDEMRKSMLIDDPNYLRGTDPNLINWRDYQGGDWEEFQRYCRQIEEYLASLGREFDWYDGVVWEYACRDGNLAPLFKALNKRKVFLVGNPRLQDFTVLQLEGFHPVPERNACSAIDEIEELVVREPNMVYIFCMGLGAVPLISRLHGKIPNATLLDCGSVFDVFVGLGESRGWRAEVYANPERLKDLIARNTEGV